MGLPVLVRGAQLANRLRTANNIVRFGRKAKAVQGLSANARAAELLAGTKVLALPTVPSLTGPIVRVLAGTFGFLASIWSHLNKPKVKPDAPVYEPVEGEFPVDIPAGQYGPLKIKYRITQTFVGKRWCASDEWAFEPRPDTVYEKEVTRSVKSASLIHKTAVKRSACQGPDGGWSDMHPVDVLGLNYTNSSGAELYRGIQEDREGTLYETAYTPSDNKTFAQVIGVEFNGQPLPNPVPTPKPEPKPRPDPVPMPEAERAMVPAPLALPAVKPKPVRVPDAEPTTEPATEPEPQRIPVRVPTRTPVKTPTKTPTLPTTTTGTTIAGKKVEPSKAIVPTTPSDVHKFGNAGGRVAGRTASRNPTQMAQELGRVEQKLAQIASKPNTIGSLADILRLLRELYEWSTNKKDGITYELEAACECQGVEGECEEPRITLQTPGGDYRDETLARIDAVAELLQPLKTWKQPICYEKPKLEGDFRTISFISDERSPFGNDRLRKRFRYRSQSSADLDTLVDHWKDFVWNAGPVCVKHSGHTWGAPQVWAASVDEGKRVIQHAGREAGVDPDQVGQWSVGGSNNPRFGVSGTMRVCTKGGYYWITERLGSSARPLVHVL